MPEFIITTTARSINDPDLEKRVSTSRRRSRAVRHARRLRAQGNRDIMLFEQRGDHWIPVSLRLTALPKFASNNGCNSVRIESTVAEAVRGIKMTFARVRNVGRSAKKAAA